MTTRKDFLVASTATAALLPSGIAVAAAAGKASPLDAADLPPLQFDLATFDAWTSTAAKHRHSYANIAVEWTVFQAMTTVLDSYEAIGETPSSVASAAVFYHGPSVALVFDDEAWNSLILPAVPKLPEKTRASFSSFKAGGGHPYYRTSAAAGAYDPSMRTLTDRGAIFFACNLATGGFARELAAATGITPAAAYEKLRAHLLPHAMLTPSGVWAIHALQERRFTYEQVTL